MEVMDKDTNTHMGAGLRAGSFSLQFSRHKRGRVYKHIGKGCYVSKSPLFVGVDGSKWLLCVMGSQDGNKGKYNSSDSREHT